MADRNWVGGDVGNEGDWDTAANWSPAAVPVAGENVYILDGDEDIDDGLDQSAVALGNVQVGPGYTGNIASSTTQLQLSFAASKRLVIDGAPALSTQEMWIDINSANAVDVDIVGYGPVTAATMNLYGVHLRRTAQTVTVVNGGGTSSTTGGKLTIDTGTIAGLVDTGFARSVIESAAVITNYFSISTGVVSTLSKVPTAKMLVSGGTITVDATSAILQVEIHGGTVAWNGGSSISTNLIVYGGTFDTSQATASAAIVAVVVYGNASTTLVDLSVASVSGAVENHATGAVLITAAASSAAIT